jgi:GntR family transcriptional regulator/MocR family aminotransferase
MPKTVSAFVLTLNHRLSDQTLTSWLYGELRSAILEGRLRPGTRLPASRDFARMHQLSRGTVVNVFERLQSEGYLSSRIGEGTWVNQRVAADDLVGTRHSKPPAYVRRVISTYKRPKPFVGMVATNGVRPFQMRDPALAEFPAKLWGRLAARNAREVSAHGCKHTMTDTDIARCAKRSRTIWVRRGVCDVKRTRSFSSPAFNRRWTCWRDFF